MEPGPPTSLPQPSIPEVFRRPKTAGAENWGGYTNPRVDTVLERLIATIPPAERLPLQRELLQVTLDDVAIAPLYWNVAPVLALENVKGLPDTGGNSPTWNF